MSFLNPIILFGLLAAAIPLLIHLLTRTKRRVILFSTLRFLKEIQNQQNRRLRLRQLLLLILRTLIVVFLILAFARPTLRGRLSVAADAKTSMVIIIDNSVSMNRTAAGESLLSIAKSKAGQILQTMQPGDQAFILTSTDTSSEFTRRTFYEPTAAGGLINGIKVSHARTDLSAALAAAHRRLADSPNINKEIYLLSDMKASGFSADSVALGSVRLYGLPLDAKDAFNFSVRSVELKSTMLQTGRLAQIDVTVANSGRKAGGSVLRLSVDEKPTAQTLVELQPGEASVEALRFPIERSGFASAHVTLEDDDLLEDNRRDLAFRVPDSLRIALVTHQPEDAFFIRLALNPANSPAPFYRAALMMTADLRLITPGAVDALFLSNVPTFEEQSAEKLRAFVESGGGLVIAFGQAVDVRSYNTVLLPLLELPPILQVISPSSHGSSEFSLSAVDLAHPLFSGIFEGQESDFSRPVFRFAVRMQPTPEIDPIIRYSSGEPFLFEKKLGNGRIIVMTSGLDPRLSDVSRRSIFAPLITGMVSYAGAAGSVFSPQAQIGDELRFQIPLMPASAVFEMERPDGDGDRVNPQITPTGAVITYTQTDLPGIYRLFADRAVIQQWAVQLSPQESLLTPLDAETLEKRLNAVIVPNDDLSAFITAQRYGAELWKLFALTALILLLFEMLLYREKGEVSPQAEGA